MPLANKDAQLQTVLRHSFSTARKGGKALQRLVESLLIGCGCCLAELVGTVSVNFRKISICPAAKMDFSHLWRGVLQQFLSTLHEHRAR